MTNRTKWLVAVPFALAIGLGAPAWVAGEWLWFLERWQDTLFTALTVGMWLAATAFVDVDRPRGEPDLANMLIPLGLILAVPLAVWDREYGPARFMPTALNGAALALAAGAIGLGVSARRSLGDAYSPRGEAKPDQAMIFRGPYRYIRHPLYLAALLWVVAWPLIIGSLLASGLALIVVLPAILGRIRREEGELLRLHGDAYQAYRARSWRLIPYVY